MTGFQDLATVAQSQLPPGLVSTVTAAMPVYTRIQATILTLPLFNERTLPARVKIAAAMALTPLFAATQPAPADVTAFALLVVQQVAVGILIALPTLVLALAINMAATAVAMTASLAQILGTGAEASPHPIGNLAHLAGLAVLCVLGYPMMVLAVVAEGFRLWPMGSFPDIGAMLPAFVGLTTRSFNLALTLAAPFILGGLMFQMLSGVINKVMPALPVVFIGAPLAILLALAGLALMLPLIIDRWADAVLSAGWPG